MYSKKDRDYMFLALKEAQKAFEENEIPVGAIIVFENKVIGKGHNQVIRLKDPTAHAEILAITSASNYLNSEKLEGCVMYCTLEPCPMCAGALVNAKVRALYYGTDDSKAGACGTLFDITQSKNLNHRVKTYSGLLNDECREILQAFFKSLRSKS